LGAAEEGAVAKEGHGVEDGQGLVQQANNNEVSVDVEYAKEARSERKRFISITSLLKPKYVED
jgi:hypothetical protein